MPAGNEGFLKLHRKIKDSAIYHAPAKAKLLFFEILLHATWEEGDYTFVGPQKIELEKGDWVTTYSEMAEKIDVSKSTCKRYLETMKDADMVRTQSETHGKYRKTRISVVNWGKYQNKNNKNETSNAKENAKQNANRNVERNAKQNAGQNDNVVKEEKKKRTEESKNTNPESGDSEELDKDSLRERFGDNPVEFTDRMIDAVNRVNERSSTPEPGTVTYKNWVQAFDRLNRLGPSGGEKGYEWEELADILEWTFDDEFWLKNVASPIQLRKKGNNGNAKIVNIENSMPDETNEEWEEI